MANIFTPNKTSAKLLVDYAAANFGEDVGSDDKGQRHLMIYDLYIKARSYAIINKIAFWLSVLSGLMVLIWPSVAVVFEDFGFQKEFLKSAIVQTTVTGLAALTFAVYSHYKKRQVYAENLMRYIIFSDESVSTMKERVLKEMERIDLGFSFSETVIKPKQDKKD